MTQPEQASPPSAGHLLARSVFALVFMALLAYLIALPIFLQISMRPEVRSMFNIVLIALLVILLAVNALALRTKPERMRNAADAIMGLLQRPWLSGGLFLLIFESNIVLFYAINAITPNLQPVLYLTAFWSVLLIVVLWIAIRTKLETWLTSTRAIWSGVGLLLTGAFILAGLFLFNGFVLDASGLLGVYRGHFDYRELVLYGGVSDPETSRAYWRELGSVQAQWLPYTYTRIQPLAGEYINVSSSGLRATFNPAIPGDDTAQVFFFGGSTVWGDGARDDYTIPSHTSRLLNADDTPVVVTNYGQVAYVTTQDLILFQTQLATGNIPDVAVFYGGFNDIMASQMHGVAGLPHNEIKRAEDFLAGRILGAGRPLLTLPRMAADQLDFSLVTREGDLIAETAAHYLALQDLIRAAAAVYDVPVLFVWQPFLNYKTPLTVEEEQISLRQEADFPGYNALYEGVDRLVRARQAPDALILADLFDENPEKVFIDRVHITEDGNARVAEAITPVLAAMLAR